MSRRILAALSAIALAAILAACWPAAAPGVHAASRTSVFRSNGWTLTITFKQQPYGETFHGSLKHAGKTYVTQGDWIPAGDAGGDLLRFYGLAFGTVRGLVSVATLYSTCNPNCAAARTFKLAPVSPWTLPGMGKGRSVILTAQA